MQRFFLLFFSLITIQLSSEGRERFAFNEKDTLGEPVKEEQLIREVIKSKGAPKKEKVQYFQQVTKYGFKNLFNNLSYNASMPYHNQVNPYAESYMQDYLETHGNALIKMKNWATPYFSLIDNILSQYGLPRELKYLAVIESNLQAGATSWVGARGPWQFMPYTAKEYGLSVNSYLDERTDYFKSTHAAAKYLLYLYKDLKDWLLVIAAYNGGPGRVYSAIQKSGSRNFWELQYYLPQESRNHVKKFIATHFIMEARGNDEGINTDYAGLEKFRQPELSDADTKNTEVMSLSGKYNSTVIAKNLLIDLGEFNRINPGFDMMMASGETFDLRLPSEKMDLFVANKYAILNECVELLLTNANTETKTIYNSRQFNNRRKKS